MKLIPQAFKDINSTRGFRDLTKKEQEAALAKNENTQPNRGPKAKRLAKGQEQKEARILEEEVNEDEEEADEGEKNDQEEDEGYSDNEDSKQANGTRTFTVMHDTHQTVAKPTHSPPTVSKFTKSQGTKRRVHEDVALNNDPRSRQVKRQRQNSSSDEAELIQSSKEAQHIKPRRNPSPNIQNQSVDRVLHQDHFADEVSRILQGDRLQSQDLTPESTMSDAGILYQSGTALPQFRSNYESLNNIEDTPSSDSSHPPSVFDTSFMPSITEESENLFSPASNLQFDSPVTAEFYSSRPYNDANSQMPAATNLFAPAPTPQENVVKPSILQRRRGGNLNLDFPSTSMMQREYSVYTEPILDSDTPAS